MLHSHCFQPMWCSVTAVEGLIGPQETRTELLVLAFLYSGAAGSFLHVKNFVGSSFFLRRSHFYRLLTSLGRHIASKLPLCQLLPITISAHGHPHSQGHLAKCEVLDTLGPSSSKGLFLRLSIRRPSIS